MRLVVSTVADATGHWVTQQCSGR